MLQAWEGLFGDVAYACCSCLSNQVIPTVGVEGDDGELRRSKLVEHFRNLVNETASKAKFLAAFKKGRPSCDNPEAAGKASGLMAVPSGLSDSRELSGICDAPSEGGEGGVDSEEERESDGDDPRRGAHSKDDKVAPPGHASGASTDRPTSLQGQEATRSPEPDDADNGPHLNGSLAIFLEVAPGRTGVGRGAAEGRAGRTDLKAIDTNDATIPKVEPTAAGDELEVPGCAPPMRHRLEAMPHSSGLLHCNGIQRTSQKGPRLVKDESSEASISSTSAGLNRLSPQRYKEVSSLLQSPVSEKCPPPDGGHAASLTASAGDRGGVESAIISQLIMVIGNQVSVEQAAQLLASNGGDLGRAINNFYDASAGAQNRPGQGDNDAGVGNPAGTKAVPAVVGLDVEPGKAGANEASPRLDGISSPPSDTGRKRKPDAARKGASAQKRGRGRSGKSFSDASQRHITNFFSSTQQVMLATAASGELCTLEDLAIDAQPPSVAEANTSEPMPFGSAISADLKAEAEEGIAGVEAGLCPLPSSVRERQLPLSLPASPAPQHTGLPVEALAGTPQIKPEPSVEEPKSVSEVNSGDCKPVKRPAGASSPSVKPMAQIFKLAAVHGKRKHAHTHSHGDGPESTDKVAEHVQCVEEDAVDHAASAPPPDSLAERPALTGVMGAPPLPMNHEFRR